MAISEGISLIRFEGSGCDCLPMHAAFLLDGFSADVFPPLMAWPLPKIDVSWLPAVQAGFHGIVVVIVPDELSDALF